MPPGSVRAWLEPLGGAVLMLAALIDLFLTVLYARAGAGFISDRVARLTWALFNWVSAAFGRRRAIVLSLSGSWVVVSLVAVWAATLTLGSALIMHPYLGSAVTSSGKSNSTDFWTALYAGGSSMSLVGASDYHAQTTAFRMVYLFNSLVGMSVMSLALTYVMQVYNALQKRNTFGLMLDQMSDGTGDAAILVSGIGPQNQFSSGVSVLGEMADSVSAIRESHDFYPVLFYFRFPEPRYSASRTTLVALDTVSLIRAAIPDGQNAWIRETASVRQLWESSISLLKTLQNTFIPGESPSRVQDPTPTDRELWGRRFSKALATLRAAGIHTIDEREGAERYISMRSRWNRDIERLASYMAWPIDEIDCATPHASRDR